MININKTRILAILILFGNFLNSQVVAPQNSKSSVIAEIRSIHGERAGDSINEFLDNLKLYTRESKKYEISKMIEFPIWVTYNKRQIQIKNEKKFVRKYNSIMNKKIQSAIEESTVENLFVNYNGIMVNRGEVWIACVINEKNPKECTLKIIRLNN